MKSFNVRPKSPNPISKDRDNVLSFKKKAPMLPEEIEKLTDGAKASLNKDPTIFEKKMKRLKKTLIKKGYTDNIRGEVYKSMMVSLLDIIPLAERMYFEKKTESSAYSLNALTNQLREIMNDLSAIENGAQQTEHINKLINNSFQHLTNNLIELLLNTQNDIANLKIDNTKSLKKYTKDKMQRLGKDFAMYAQEVMLKTNSDIQQYLTE